MNPQTPPTAEANPAVAERTALRLSVGEKFALPGKLCVMSRLMQPQN